MRRFSIPCDFAGVKHPFEVYIGEPCDEDHPLRFQSAWLSEIRGGVVPEKVMSSFAKLHQLSIENNVSFEELCAYALSTAKSQEEKKQETPDSG